MHTFERGGGRRTVHFLWPEEAGLDNSVGQPGDYWEQYTAAGLKAICGPKSTPTLASPRGVWPAAVTIGAAGTPGPASPALNDRGAWAPGTAYGVNDVVTWWGQRWARLTAGTSGAAFSPAGWINLGRQPSPVKPVNGDFIGPSYSTVVANTTLPTIAAGSGLLTSVPFFAPPSGGFNGFNINVGTAQSGGTATFTVALFLDAGIDGLTPDWAAGPVASSDSAGTPFSLTTAGGQNALLSGAIAWQPNALYHLVTRYLVSAAVTTPAKLAMSSGPPIDGIALPRSAGNATTKGMSATGTMTGWPTSNPGPTWTRENGTIIAAAAVRSSG